MRRYSDRMRQGDHEKRDGSVPGWVTEVRRAFESTGAPVDLTVDKFPELARALGVDSDIALHDRLVDEAHSYEPTGTAPDRVKKLGQLRAAFAWLWVNPYHLESSEWDAGLGRNKPPLDGMGTRNAWAYNNYKFVLADVGEASAFPRPQELRRGQRPPAPRFDASQERSGRNNRAEFVGGFIEFLATVLGETIPTSSLSSGQLPEAGPRGMVEVVGEHSEPAQDPSDTLEPSPRRRGRRAAILSSLVAGLAVVALALTGTATEWYGLASADTAEVNEPIDIPISDASGSTIQEASWGPQDRLPVSEESRNSQVVLNSMIDRPGWDDERDFMRVAPAPDGGGELTNALVVDPGAVYEVTVFFGNDASPEDETAVSTNTQLTLDLPRVAIGSASWTALLSSDNATPAEVWDGVVFALPEADAQAALRPVSGSAVLHSDGAVDGTVLDDAVFDGAPILLGCDAMDGVLPSRDDCAGRLTFKMRVDQPNFTVTALARLKGADAPYSAQVAASVGDVLEVGVSYQNTGTNQQDNVSLRIVDLPDGLRYIGESSQIMNSTTEGELRSTIDGVTTTGINVGSYQPKGNVFFTFDLMVDEAILGASGESRWISIDPFARVTTNAGYKEAPLSLAVLSGG